MKNKNNNNPPDRTSEEMTSERTTFLENNGASCAKIAKSKGQTVDDSRGYISLIGDNNIAVWKSGWDAEWVKVKNGSY